MKKQTKYSDRLIKLARHLKRGLKVKIAIPAGRPIRLLNGTLHSAGETYKVLGGHGTCARLSRVGDFAKIICQPSELYLA